MDNINMNNKDVFNSYKKIFSKWKFTTSLTSFIARKIVKP